LQTLAKRSATCAEIQREQILRPIDREQGLGVFAAPTVIERETRSRYQVQVVGRTQQVRQQFYAISLERTVKHPAVVAICEGATRGIFTRSQVRGDRNGAIE